jgi:hypothetical protein
MGARARMGLPPGGPGGQFGLVSGAFCIRDSWLFRGGGIFGSNGRFVFIII